MRRAAIVTSILLTLMSGFVLSQLWALEPVNVGSPQAVTSSQVEETALKFYQAVNAYLDDGDDASLRRMLHPGFVTHQPSDEWAGSAEDFFHHLDSLRLLYPRMWLEPEAVSLGNNLASVTLAVSDVQRREFAGIGIDPVETVGQLDIVRIERGLIAERWSSAPLAGRLVDFPAQEIELPFAVNTLLARVQEIPLEGASDPVISHVRNLLLIVKSGEALLDVTSQSSSPAMIWRVNDGRVAAAAQVEPEMTVALNPMEAVYLPTGTGFRLWDSSNLDTTLIALEFGPPMSGQSLSNTPQLEILEGSLWSGIELEEVGNRLTLSFGHATLPPHSTLSSREVDGMELTWVTSGSLALAGSSGEVRVRKASGTRSQLIEGQAFLDTGEAAASGPGSNIMYQVSGDAPSAAWFFSIVPVHSPESADSAEATPIPTPAPRPNSTLS